MQTLRRIIESADNHNMDNWRVYIDTYELDERARQLSPHTIKVNDERLLLLARWLNERGVDIETVTCDHIKQYLISLYGKVADETIAGRIRTYRRFFTVLIESGIWNKAHPLVGIKKPRVARKLRKTIAPHDFDRVLSCCDKRSFLGYRNHTMLLMMWDCMLRRGEIAGLQMEDVDIRAGVLRVRGKGDKVRLVPMGAKTMKALHYYLHKYRKALPGANVYCNRTGLPLTLGHIRQVCCRTAKKAGIHMGAHIIRHSAATEYLRLGGQLGLLSKILGHADLSTTAIYTHLLTTDMVRSYDKFSPANSLHV